MDMKQSMLFTAPAELFDQFAEQFDAVISAILDHHCPLQTGNEHPPWWLYRKAIDTKQERRQLERKWKSYHIEVDLKKYRAACRMKQSCLVASFTVNAFELPTTIRVRNFH